MKKWEEFLENKKKELKEEVFNKWIKPLKIIKFDARNIYLEAKNYFQLTWFEEHIRPQLKNNFLNSNFQKIKVHISLPNSENIKKIKKLENKKPYQFKISFDSIEEDFNFSSFYSFEKNKVAFKFLSNLAGYNINTKKFENQKKEEFSLFNPIFIYGPKESGKTHLLSAIAKAFKDKNTIFVKAQTFTNHVVNSIRLSSIQKFREIYRNSDLLIIDDIHVLSERRATQEELFHTFNALHSKNSQIILSSNSYPKYLKSIESRLISRFEWGIILSLDKVDNKGLETILEQKIKDLSLNLPLETKKFILKTFPSPLMIKKVLDAIVLRRKNIEHLNTPNVTKLVEDLIHEQNTNKLSFEKIIKKTAEHFGITVKDILGKSQTKECSFPRHLAMYFCRNKLTMTFKEIGKNFQRDHSTVITRIRQIDKNEKSIYNTLLEIENSFEV